MIGDGNNYFISDHYYNNTADFQINANASPITINLSAIIFDNPAGNYQNFTNLSVNDSATSESYSINWAANASALPSGSTSFNQNFIYVSTTTGSPSIDHVSFNWVDSDLSSYNESQFRLFKYNGTWTDLNSTPDTVGNTLSLSNLASFSNFGILQYNPNSSLWLGENWLSCRDLNTTGATNLGNASYALCAIANSSVHHNLNCTDLRIVKSDNSSAYPSFVQYCHANLTDLYPLADNNSSLICANMTDGALQARLCYRNPGAPYVSDPTQVYEVYQNSSNGINGAFANQQAGVMTNTYPYSFLGDTLFYLNDTTSSTYPTSADLGYALPSNNKTTWECEAAIIPMSNPYYAQFCGASYGIGNVTNGICGNYPLGFYNMLDGQNQYTTGAMSWSINTGGSYHPYTGVTMAQGNLTIVQAIYINNRTELLLVNGTERGANQSYSLANITAFGFSVGEYGKGVDKLALGQLKCGHALNQTQSVALGPEVNYTASTDYIGLSYTTGTILDAIIGRWSEGALAERATQITTSGTNNITRVQLALQKVGSPSGNLNLRIETDASGAPSGTLVNESAYANITTSSVPDSVAYADFNFTPFSLNAGTYWIVLNTNEPSGNNVGVYWQRDGTNVYRTDRSSWISSISAFNYKLYYQNT